VERHFYPALVHKGKDGTYGISFIDLPVTSLGDSWQDCLVNGIEAAALYVDMVAENGGDIPAPTPWDGIDAKIGAKDRVGLLSAVPMPIDLPSRSKRISVSIDQGLLLRIDRLVGEGGRSQFLANAARQQIASQTSAPRITRRRARS